MPLMAVERVLQLLWGVDMSKDIIEMRYAMYNAMKKVGPPKDLIVGSGAAEAMGFPHAGHWHLNDENEYVFKGPLTEETEW